MPRIDELLATTSRTFALSIPLLPQPTQRELGVAYLLFRIADTFEDAADWSKARRVDALHDFDALLSDPVPERARQMGRAWADGRPIEHAGYLELLRETDTVMAAFTALDPAAQEIIRRDTLRTTAGMADFVERTQDGQLLLRDLDDLRQYCYIVAGIVGEMSTDLFVLGREALSGIAESLRARAPRFGEALQLVNILKDAAFDSREGRGYLPAGVDRDEVFDLARTDLEVAAGYTNDLQTAAAPRGVVAFCALPVRLAHAALDAVRQGGPGTKVTREQVFVIVDAMNRALDAGTPAVALEEALGR
jgi:farnesyl-diphosphate farnesyltransferase